MTVGGEHFVFGTYTLIIYVSFFCGPLTFGFLWAIMIDFLPNLYDFFDAIILRTGGNFMRSLFSGHFHSFILDPISGLGLGIFLVRIDVGRVNNCAVLPNKASAVIQVFETV